MSNSFLSRRSFLQLSTFAVLSSPSLCSAAEGSAFLNAPERSLSFYNLHTSERLSRVYWSEGKYVPQSLAEINYLLRDYRTNEVLEIAPNLLDTLCELRMQLDTNETFELISGYRSPKTNTMLREQGHGVAVSSLHLKGMAADIRIPGRSLELIRRAALNMKKGGVGYYPGQFVHVDVGRVRAW
jgi:uncharacterized protein YcbK (DUF882 family)